jgi:hypothetical protein
MKQFLIERIIMGFPHNLDSSTHRQWMFSCGGSSLTGLHCFWAFSVPRKFVLVLVGLESVGRNPPDFSIPHFPGLHLLLNQ